MTTVRTADYPELVRLGDATHRLKQVQRVKRHTFTRENGQLTGSIEADDWSPEDPAPLIAAGARAASSFRAANDDQRVLAAALLADLTAAASHFLPELGPAHAGLRRRLTEAGVRARVNRLRGGGGRVRIDESVAGYRRRF